MDVAMELAATNPRRRVLLLEDHADTRGVFATVIRRAGHQVDTAGTLEQARRLFEQSPFDIVLCDIGLPDGSGLEVPRWRRSHCPDIRLIAFTAHAMMNELDEMRAAGFDLILTKPISIDLLIAALSIPPRRSVG